MKLSIGLFAVLASLIVNASDINTFELSPSDPCSVAVAQPANVADALSLSDVWQQQARIQSIFNDKPKVSIVVDDLGDNSIVAKQLLNLPIKVTAAILPHTPHATKIAQWAADNGHQVIMHLPMEAFSRPDLLGPGALRANMDQQKIEATMTSSAASIPYLRGFNNHMGSLLTEDPQKMRWVMESAKKRGWFFLDSKTSESSVAQIVANQVGLKNISRDIFLDHHTPANISQLDGIILKRFKKALKIAEQRGHVVIICHPYPQTVKFFEQELPKLVENIELVTLSQLVTSVNSHNSGALAGEK